MLPAKSDNKLFRVAPPLSPDDEVGTPLCVLVEDVIDAVQRGAELGHVERRLDLGQHVRLGVAGLQWRFVGGGGG